LVPWLFLEGSVAKFGQQPEERVTRFEDEFLNCVQLKMAVGFGPVGLHGRLIQQRVGAEVFQIGGRLR